MSMENLKKVVSFGLEAGAAVLDASTKTGNLAKAAAMLHLAEDIPELMGVDYSQIMPEFKALDAAGLDDLNAHIETQFSIPDAEKEKKIEAAISVVIDIAKVVEKALAIWDSSKS